MKNTLLIIVCAGFVFAPNNGSDGGGSAAGDMGGVPLDYAELVAVPDRKKKVGETAQDQTIMNLAEPAAYYALSGAALSIAYPFISDVIAIKQEFSPWGLAVEKLSQDPEGFEQYVLENNLSSNTKLQQLQSLKERIDRCTTSKKDWPSLAKRAVQIGVSQALSEAVIKAARALIEKMPLGSVLSGLLDAKKSLIPSFSAMLSDIDTLQKALLQLQQCQEAGTCAQWPPLLITQKPLAANIVTRYDRRQQTISRTALEQLKVFLEQRKRAIQKALKTLDLQTIPIAFLRDAATVRDQAKTQLHEVNAELKKINQLLLQD